MDIQLPPPIQAYQLQVTMKKPPLKDEGRNLNVFTTE